MCEQCQARAVTYVGPKKKNVLPNYFLVRATKNGSKMKEGDWGLVRINDPDYIWSITPLLDPDDGLSDEEIISPFKDNNYKEDSNYKEFYKAVSNIEKSLNSGSFDKAIQLGEAMKKSGYNPHKHGYRSAFWLCDHIAKFLKTATITKD